MQRHSDRAIIPFWSLRAIAGTTPLHRSTGPSTGVRLRLTPKSQGEAPCMVETGLKPVSTCRTIATKFPPCEGGDKRVVIKSNRIPCDIEYVHF